MKSKLSSTIQIHIFAGKSPNFDRISFSPIDISFAVAQMSADDIPKPRKARLRREPKQKPSIIIKSEGVAVRDIEDFGIEEVSRIRTSLLRWYDENKRDLPWRRIVDGDCGEEEGSVNRRAYAVWVSEVMLQQTRVATVVDYYNRWMEKWPSLHQLAQASLEDINEMWAGLGYYRRGRFLLEGAKMIVEEGGNFPTAINDIRKVRGIGEYTAGAIASIALNEAVPVVDGNVIRVIARLKAISSNPKDSLSIKNFWKLAAQLVDLSRPGDFNQALMELGATICSPLNPTCSACPISGQCLAFSESKLNSLVKVTDYPMKVVKAKPRHESAAVCVVEILNGHDNGLFLLIKRPDSGLLAGLWEFPSVLLDGEVDLTTRQKEIDQFLKKSFTIEARKTCSIVSREVVGEIVHIFSHIRLKMYVELLVLNLKEGVDILSRNKAKETMVWKCVDNKELSCLGLTSGVRKVYAMTQKFKETRVTLVPNNAKRKRTKVSRKNTPSENRKRKELSSSSNLHSCVMAPNEAHL